MPINNDFYGVYKFITIKTDNGVNTGLNPYVVQSLNVKDAEPTNPKFYIQGTPNTKVLEIRPVAQDLSVNAPILVGPANIAIIDGLYLLHDLFNLQYTNGLPNNSLPLLVNATIKIGADGSSVNFTLKSDGDPNNSVNVYEVNYGATAQSYITATNLDKASRTAMNYDFFVNFGGLKWYVEDCTINIKITASENNFLGVYRGNTVPANYEVPYDDLNDGVWDPSTEAQAASYSGWQFPFISVGGIEITASGKAAISINNVTGVTTNYSQLDTVTSNVDALRLASNVTLQKTGELNYVTPSFQIYYSGGRNAAIQGVIPPALGIQTAIVTQRSSSFSEGKMYADFEVQAYVGF